MLKEDLFYIKGQVLKADLIILDLHRLNVILGMDWLIVNHTFLYCFCKEIIFRQPRLPLIEFYGKKIDTPSYLISVFSTHCLLNEDCMEYLAHVFYTKASEVTLEDVPAI